MLDILIVQMYLCLHLYQDWICIRTPFNFEENDTEEVQHFT